MYLHCLKYLMIASHAQLFLSLALTSNYPALDWIWAVYLAPASLTLHLRLFFYWMLDWALNPKFYAFLTVFFEDWVVTSDGKTDCTTKNKHKNLV